MVQGRAAGAVHVAVQGGLRPGGRPGLRARLGEVQLGQAIGLARAEDAELAEHRHRRGAGLARGRVAVLLVQGLPERHERALLARADLPAALGDLPYVPNHGLVQPLSCPARESSQTLTPRYGLPVLRLPGRPAGVHGFRHGTAPACRAWVIRPVTSRYTSVLVPLAVAVRFHPDPPASPPSSQN